MTIEVIVEVTPNSRTIVSDEYISVPGNGVEGQVLGKTGSGSRDIGWVDPSAASGGLPVGGATGQVLAKTSNANYATGWVDPQSGPKGDKGEPGATGPAGAPGAAGADGLSAYEVAVANGFVGTEPEWLASLQGDDGEPGATGPAGATGAAGADGLSAYEVAVANGFVGTESEWLASLKGDDGEPGATGPAGAPGAAGADGLSAYEVAVANGFVGTESEWLASLQGDDGEPGATGPEGATGAAGADGLSAYEVAVANGFVGTESEWLASLKGEKGDPGDPGAGGYTGIVFSEDFVRGSGATGQDFAGNAISGGNNTSVTPSSILSLGHVGVMRLTSSASANSGYYYGTSNSYGNQLQSGEIFDAIFCTPTNVHADIVFRAGIMASPGASAPSNGIYIRTSGTVLDAVCVSSSSASVTSTSYTLTADTWYNINIAVNESRSSVEFKLFSDAGTLLWSSTLSTNIPNGSSTIMARAFVALNTGTVSRDLVHLDFLRVEMPFAQRGRFRNA